MREFHGIVEGKVQGVFFRLWTKDQAEKLELAGWVRNLPDGTVEVLAQGGEDVLGQFQARLRQGSPMSRVTAVRGELRDPSDSFQGFAVSR